MIQLVVVLSVKPEFSNIIMETARPLVEGSQKEDGNICYELVKDVANPDTFMFLEQWRDDEALTRHGKTEHFTTICPKINEMCIKSVLHRIEK